VEGRDQPIHGPASSPEHLFQLASQDEPQRTSAMERRTEPAEQVLRRTPRYEWRLGSSLFGQPGREEGGAGLGRAPASTWTGGRCSWLRSRAASTVKCLAREGVTIESILAAEVAQSQSLPRPRSIREGPAAETPRTLVGHPTTPRAREIARPKFSNIAGDVIDTEQEIRGRSEAPTL
jgi:hypothetical protein